MLFGHHSSLAAGIISIPGLDHHFSLLGCDVDMAIPLAGVRFLRRVTQAVLIAQLLLNLIVRFVNGQLLRNFEKRAAGLPGDAFEDLFSIRAVAAACSSVWHFFDCVPFVAAA